MSAAWIDAVPVEEARQRLRQLLREHEQTQAELRRQTQRAEAAEREVQRHRETIGALVIERDQARREVIRVQDKCEGLQRARVLDPPDPGQEPKVEQLIGESIANTIRAAGLPLQELAAWRIGRPWIVLQLLYAVEVYRNYKELPDSPEFPRSKAAAAIEAVERDGAVPLLFNFLHAPRGEKHPPQGHGTVLALPRTLLAPIAAVPPKRCA